MILKYISIVLTICTLSIILLAFQSNKQDLGKILFNQSCASCHLPDKTISTGPSFQKIRSDYGLKWTIRFLRNPMKMVDSGDINATYSYYLFNQIRHNSFPALEEKYIISVLDYVDRLSLDSSQINHRFVSKEEKLKFINTRRNKLN